MLFADDIVLLSNTIVGLQQQLNVLRNTVKTLLLTLKKSQVLFSTGLAFSYAFKDMSDRARKGALGILRLLWRLGEQCPKLFFKLFDCQIQPMLTYGSEVWGIMADYSIIARVHLFAIKRFLNVSTRTPSALVYGKSVDILFMLTHTQDVLNIG